LVALAIATLPALSLSAQEPTTISGRVVASGGQIMANASVFISSMNLGTLTNAQGRYILIVPAARAAGQTVKLEVSQIGYKTESANITLSPGPISHDFTLSTDPLKLDEIVVTGQGTQTTREKLGVTVTTVNAQQVTATQDNNMVAAMAGAAPNVQVIQSSGEPGAGTYIRIRGENTIEGSVQPLFIVDGVPLNNDTYTIEGTTAGTAAANRALDINPNDIASIEILKGPAAGAIYGSRAASGVVIITTKSGKPGTNRVSLKSSISVDNMDKMQPLQFQYGQGMAGTPYGEAGTNLSPTSSLSWGLPLPCAQSDPTTDEVTSFSGCKLGADYWDHGTEMFRTGYQLDNTLEMSGGSENTTYYLSIGRTDDQGVIKGNSLYQRSTARLKGSHTFSPTVTVSGNLAYTNSAGDLIQQGSNISGLLLGALRTPPSFDNLPYLDPNNGLHRSYRDPNPTVLAASRGYDNPYWIVNRILNKTDVARTIGQVSAQWQPRPWLNVNYVLGADITDDNERHLFPKSSSNFPNGAVIRGNFTEKIFDSNLILTANHTFNDNVSGTLTLGQNLNEDTYKRYQVNGENLIYGTDQLDFAIDKVPNEYYSQTHTAGYFAQGSTDLFNQLYLTAAARLDGSSTFGAEAKSWFVYPKLTAAWNFSNYSMFKKWNWLSFGKLRAAYGVTGKQPPIYTNVSSYQTGTLADGWTNGVQTIYGGADGVYHQGVKGNPAIKPERTSGLDLGGDLAFFNSKLTFGLTYYTEDTKDVILAVPLPPSTGYTSQWSNGAEIQNHGLEITLGGQPIARDNFSFNIDASWAKNVSCVKSLAGSDFIALAGFTSSLTGLVAPEKDANGHITHCYQYNTLYGDDFVRFGRGSVADGVNIDQAYPTAPKGAVYIGADGLPRYDAQDRPYVNANPDWTAQIRPTFTFYKNLSISALFDFNHGSHMWNGTRGALDYFGTSASTQPYHGLGVNRVFGKTILPSEKVAGPGAGKEVLINGDYFYSGLGSGFTGPFTQFVENSGFVKLREISLAYTARGGLVDRLGFSSVDLRVSGRNLATWTKYTGIDPESNLTAQSAGRGLEYFNNPRVRSWVFTLTLNR
jgi:TonB-linked SusC/RagA family outer membrane protein